LGKSRLVEKRLQRVKRVSSSDCCMVKADG
jgi:hypothetical protein